MNDFQYGKTTIFADCSFVQQKPITNIKQSLARDSLPSPGKMAIGKTFSAVHFSGITHH